MSRAPAFTNNNINNKMLADEAAKAAMLPAPTLNDASFVQFIDYYKEFERLYRESQYAGNERDNVCFMTFGVTGAGKSTTIARILSNLTPEDFQAQLRSGSDQNAHLVKIEDVAISGAPTATTIIPRVYTVPGANRQLHLCDMPGLRDNDSFKQIVIDVLLKCILTRVQKTRYLIVVQMSRFKDMADVRMLLADYHDYLLKMFGRENYLTAIDNFYFVFTHPDDRSLEDIDKYFSEALLWLARYGSPAPTAEENRFLARILRSKMVVDLRVDTNRTVLQSLQALITLDEANKEARFVPTSKEHIVSLRAGEDRLIVQCELHVRQYLHEVSNLQARILVTDNDVTAYVTDWEKTVTTTLQNDVALETELERLRANRHEVETRLGAFPNDMNSQQILRAELVSRREVSERVLEIFNKEVTASDAVSWRCDDAVQAAAVFAFSSAPRFVLDVNAVLPTHDGQVVPWVVLILPQDRADNVLRSFSVDRPITLSQFMTVRSNDVLFNSATNFNPRKFIFNVDGNVFRMKVDLEMRFRVYIYTSRKFDTLPQYARLQEDFASPIKLLKNRIIECDRTTQERQQQNERDIITLGELMSNIPVAEERLSNSRKDLADKRAKTQDEITAFRRTLDDNQAKLQDLQGNKVKSINEINDILGKNNIVANLSVLLGQYRTQIEQSLGHISTIRARYEAFQNKILHLIDTRLPQQPQN